MYIAISGNLGSGKSTLARGLAKEFNCALFPIKSYDESYIEDLFKNPGRWTFEAQAGFLIHKYNEIRNGLGQSRLFILDRTIQEDIEVFAEKFHDDGFIDNRSMDLLRGIYRGIAQQIEPPRLIIFCDCPPEICEQRIERRPRRYQGLYPADHLRKLDAKLNDWVSSITDVPVLKVDTVKHNFNSPGTIRDIAGEIDRLTRRSQTMDQNDLFSPPAEDPKDRDRLLEPINLSPALPIQLSPQLILPKRVYLAAPFTSRAHKKSLDVPSREGLFQGTEYIESIPQHYRRNLLRIVSAIENHGYSVLLPHRDINRWGHRALPAGEIAIRCLDAITECDYFVGLIGESFGSHVELGLALGMHKPVLLLAPKNLSISFFGSGILASGRVRVLMGRSLSEIASKLRENDLLPA